MALLANTTITTIRPRLYDSLLRQHFSANRQMAFVSGPRQVGKTTTCRFEGAAYFNWDNSDDRRVVLRGPAAVADRLGLDQLRVQPPMAVFDELHKYAKWRPFLKGFFDVYGGRVRLIVTGSSRLDVYRRGGDSLMGRYFLYRMHPFSVAECLRVTAPSGPIQGPALLPDPEWDALWQHGGFPEPFLRRESTFTVRWRGLRHDQLMREDVRDMAQVQDLGSLEHLSLLLAERSAQQLIFSGLAQEVGVANDTVRRWIDLLERLHFGFRVRPWFTNVTKALRKEPKWFLRDWSGIDDAGARAETFVGCHLLKAVEGWTDMGFGRFELRYLRDKSKREVDFLIVRDRKPWVLVEVKTNQTGLSDSLRYFHSATRAGHAFQVVMNMPYVEVDCFSRPDPAIVPARTLLSQLL